LVPKRTSDERGSSYDHQAPETPDSIAVAHEHLKAAMAALGVEPVTMDDVRADKAAARQVHAVAPGVPAHVALTVIRALRAMGWTA
jgi:hypothetical protein